eukprot:TRINITY_DN2853_c1_g1_i4.p1 TRINITY_DN2853_c1_g1~~TRINITY_DN2853_c1_g1_i4.p1  ORF type:complete len:337 (+),score=53.02 TRINITY_DN2853_c1_g1_i4:2354-3364(+)
MWYRPPELLLEGDSYSSAIDVWSAGCLLAEMFMGEPLFRGDTCMKQMSLITNLCGTPNESNWPGVNKLQGYRQLREEKRRCLGATLSAKCWERRKGLLDKHGDGIPKLAVDLIEKMLSLDPAQRITVNGAIEHRYFYCDADQNFVSGSGSRSPIPLEVPGRKQCHEWEMKRERQQNSNNNNNNNNNRGQNRASTHMAAQPQWDKGRKGGKGNAQNFTNTDAPHCTCLRRAPTRGQRCLNCNRHIVATAASRTAQKRTRSVSAKGGTKGKAKIESANPQVHSGKGSRKGLPSQNPIMQSPATKIISMPDKTRKNKLTFIKKSQSPEPTSVMRPAHLK